MMMKSVNIGMVVLTSVWAVFFLSGFGDNGLGNKSFTDRDLKGRYGYSFEAQFGAGLGQMAVEAGVFKADGKGVIEATGTAFVDGAGPIEATYSCSYAVNSDGRAPVECARTTDNGTVTVKFLLVLIKHAREAHFVAFPSDPPFDVVHLLGRAAKQ